MYSRCTVLISSFLLCTLLLSGGKNSFFCVTALSSVSEVGSTPLPSSSSSSSLKNSKRWGSSNSNSAIHTPTKINDNNNANSATDNNNNSNDSNPMAFDSTRAVPTSSSHATSQGAGAATTTFIAECEMPTLWGNFIMRSYKHSSSSQEGSTTLLEPMAIVSGDVRGREDVIVRVHDQCFTSEVFGSKRCDCREQLEQSLKLIKEEGGVVVYLQQEGRGIGLSNKIRAYELQDTGMDTVDANLHLGFEEDQREYSCLPYIIKDLGIKSIRLVTNNPFKISQLTSLGVKVSGRIPIEMKWNKHNLKYLQSKKLRMHHNLDLSSSNEDSGEGGSRVLKGGSSDSSSADGSNSDSGAPQITKEMIDAHLEKGYAFGKESVQRAIDEIAKGNIVLVVDDERRENEGDLIMAAEMATPEKVGYIVRYSSGVLCISLENDRLKQLNLPPMVANNEDPKQTAYSVSVDCIHNTTTGISAHDRAVTFRKLADPLASASDFHRPGHVFPLRYKPGGVVARAGHTEASLDLSRLAGLKPAAVLAEVVNDDGSVARLPQLQAMAREHGLVLTSVQDIIAYRLETGK